MGNTPQRPGMLAVDLLNVIRKVQHMVMRPLFTLLFYVFALLFFTCIVITVILSHV